MTPSQIKNSKWGRAFQRECPGYWEDALSYVSKPDVAVRVVCSYEQSIEGEYAIIVNKTDFWLDAFKYKKDAVALCKKMGWRVVK